MDENEDFDRYTEFFSDVFPEVKKFGNIVSFKVSLYNLSAVTI